jgi:hypothetical protein
MSDGLLDEQQRVTSPEWEKEIVRVTGIVAKHHLKAAVDNIDLGYSSDASMHTTAATFALGNDIRKYHQVCEMGGFPPQSDNWKKVLKNQP